MRNIAICLAVLSTVAAETARAQVTSSFVRQWGSGGSGNGQFSGTHADGWSPLNRIYVADEAAHRVQYFTMNGTFLGKFGQWGQGTNDIVNPVHFAFLPDGTVYVVERDNNRIHVFTANGGHLAMWGTAGSGDGQFNKPAAIAIAPDGTFFVTDRLNHRVQHFTSNGAFLGKFGTYGSGNGQFNEPYGVAVSADGTIFVSDSQNRRLQVFDANGTYLRQWGSTGSGNGQFGNASIYNNGPAHVAIDDAGRVWVADPNNWRVQIFTPAGTYIGQVGSGYGTSNGKFAFPNCVALAPGWQVYVADETDNLIQQMSVVIGTNSEPRVVGLFPAGTNLVLQVEGLPDRTYTVEKSQDLQAWTSIATRNGPEGLFAVTTGVDQGSASVIYRTKR